MADLLLVLRLFRLPLILIALIYISVVMTILVLFTLKDAYKQQLQLQFVTKQPHISVSFINDNVIMDHKAQSAYVQKLQGISEGIASVTPFSSAKSFFTAQGRKEGGDAFFTGFVTLIGIDPKVMVYDFYSAQLVGRPPFEIQYTPLEFLQRWHAHNEKEPFVVFNKTLFNSFFPVIASLDRFDFKNDRSHALRLGAVFEDFDETSIVYSSLSSVNTILHRPKDHVDGFYINVSDYDQIEAVKNALQRGLATEDIQVSSWLEKRQKQFEIFMLYEALSWVVAILLLLLALLLIFLSLYYAIVKKSYQLSLLFTLGFSIEKVLKIAMVTLMLLGSLLAYYGSVQISATLFVHLGFSVGDLKLWDNLEAMLLLNVFTMVIAVRLIRSAYKMKLKSLI